MIFSLKLFSAQDVCLFLMALFIFSLPSHSNLNKNFSIPFKIRLLRSLALLCIEALCVRERETKHCMVCGTVCVFLVRLSSHRAGVTHLKKATKVWRDFRRLCLPFVDLQLISYFPPYEAAQKFSGLFFDFGNTFGWMQLQLPDAVFDAVLDLVFCFSLLFLGSIPKGLCWSIT